MSDTPETDAEHARMQMGGFTMDFCRKLERERDEARNDLEFRRELYRVQGNYLEQARKERDEAMQALSGRTVSCAACNHAAIERDEAREERDHWKTEYEIVVARLCGKKHPRDNEIISEHEIIPNLERERNEAREALAAAKVKIKELEGQVSYARHERNKALNEIDEYKATFDVRWQAQMRAVARWQEETKKETMWPGHEDLCLWLIRKLEAAK